MSESDFKKNNFYSNSNVNKSVNVKTLDNNSERDFVAIVSDVVQEI